MDHKKLTINVAPELHTEMQRLADQRGISLTELIRRAVLLDKFVWENREAELLLRDGSGLRQIVLV